MMNSYISILTIVPMKKRTIFWLAITLSILVLVLMPFIVQASGLGGYLEEKLIERSGTSDSQLIVGRDGVSDSRLITGTGGVHINPSTTLYKMIALLPIFFATLIIYILLKMFFNGDIDIKTLIIAVIFISVAAACAVTFQGEVLNLLK